MLAAKLERWDAAEAHFAAALERCELLGARPLRARVLLEQARALRTRAGDGDLERAEALLGEARRLSEDVGLPEILRRVDDLASAASRGSRAVPAGARFVREGEFWTIGYDGETLRLRDVKGLRHIGFLLAAPGVDVHVLELAAAAEGFSRNGAGSASLAEAGLRPGRPADLDPVLDPRAKAEYRARLEDLGAELEEARTFADPERAVGVEEEIAALVGELSHAAGLGGRDRRGPAPGERARVNVTKAIRTAIRMIGRDSPALAEHLGGSIRTGRFCTYAPPGERPPPWAT
jgi:hypothetical protein